MTISDDRDTRVIRLTGELDTFSCQRLSRLSRSWLRGSRKVVVNLDALEYIDSSGLSSLVGMWVDAKDIGVQMIISCNNPRIHRILEITGLLKFFTLESTEPEPASIPAAMVAEQNTASRRLAQPSGVRPRLRGLPHS